ncbi:MAG: hypothetical protein U9Q18_07180 [Caldisericota bacterium]|nr:hypothetical protein [Caldisericota bacterium]
MAYLLVIVLNKTEKIESVLERFIEVDIRGATIIDSVGMGRTLESEIPIFGTLQEILSGGKGKRPENKTIFTVIKEERTLRDAERVVKEELSNFTEPGTGIMFVLPIMDFKGLSPSLKEEEKSLKEHRKIEKIV